MAIGPSNSTTLKAPDNRCGEDATFDERRRSHPSLKSKAPYLLLLNRTKIFDVK